MAFREIMNQEQIGNAMWARSISASFIVTSPAFSSVCVCVCVCVCVYFDWIHKWISFVVVASTISSLVEQLVNLSSSFDFYSVFLLSLKVLSSFWILASLREMHELEICWGRVILRPTILLTGKILLEENQERVLARPVALRYSETTLVLGKPLSLKVGEQPLFTCCRTSGFCCIKCNSLWPAWVASRHRSDFLPSFAMCLKR